MTGGRSYRLRHRSRWHAVLERDGTRVAVLRRRFLSRRSRPLDRTRPPRVRPVEHDEVDQLAVVLAACVMGPPGRTGFWGELGSELASSASW